MALSTFSELKTAIANFLNRDDLTTAIPDFITLAEASINRHLRHWRMLTNSTLTLDAQYEALPSDWLGTKRMTITTGTTSRLEPASEAEIHARRDGNSNAVGCPLLYAHIGANVEFWPTPDATYSVRWDYWQKVEALSDGNTSNWLLTNAPDVYLYGSLMHSAPYLHHDARLAVWAQMYAAAVQRLNESGHMDENSGPLRLRLR